MANPRGSGPRQRRAPQALRLCAGVLLLGAVAAGAVALLLWNSDVARQWRACREREANATVALEDWAQEGAELRWRLQEGARREEELGRQLARTEDSKHRLNSTLRACQKHESELEANVTALRNQVAAAWAESTEIGTQNIALQEELARWKEAAAGTEQRLDGALRRWQAVEAERDQCRVRHFELQGDVRNHLAEITALRKQLRSRSGRVDALGQKHPRRGRSEISWRQRD